MRIWRSFWIKYRFKNFERSSEDTKNSYFRIFIVWVILTWSVCRSLYVDLCFDIYLEKSSKIFELKMSFEDDPINWFVQKESCQDVLYYLTPLCGSSEIFSPMIFWKIFKSTEKVLIMLCNIWFWYIGNTKNYNIKILKIMKSKLSCVVKELTFIRDFIASSDHFFLYLRNKIWASATWRSFYSFTYINLWQSKYLQWFHSEKAVVQ